MGIKDNFSQAVKELWKKDGQGEAPSNNDGANGSMLDQYLKQDGTQPQVQPGIEVGGGGVPLETPYYPSKDTGTAQGTAEVQNQPAQQSGQFVQDSSDVQYERGNQGAQYNRGAQYNQANQGSQYGQGVQYGQGAQYNSDAQYNRGAQQSQGYQDYQGSEGASAPYYPNATQVGFNQGNASQGGYRQENPGNYNVNRSLNGGAGNNGGAVPPAAGGMMAAQSGNETDEVTVISKNTSIDGNVRSLANMHIDGNVKGNVETTKNVEMTGKIVGDITCNNSVMNSAAMQGNISLKGRMKMDRDTILIGDLSSQYADINGRIRGKLDIVGKAELKRDAIVFGDINASTIAVTDGAIIQGYVNTTFLSKEDSRNVFPEAISLENKGNPNNSSNN